MKVTFVYSSYENLGIEYLASLLEKEGHKTELVFDPRLFDDGEFNIKFLKKVFSFKADVIKEILSSNPDLIAFSPVTNDYKWACEIAKEVKKRKNIPIIFGGIHSTSVPEKVINEPFVDMVCVGEGEYTLLELVNSFEQGIRHNIKNIWFKVDDKIIKNDVRPLLQDLDRLPFLKKEGFYKKHPASKIGYGTITSRGCPYNCTYCSNSVLKKIYYNKGKYLRRRSVGNVITELQLAKKKYNPKFVRFHDENFTSDSKWLKDFITEYKKNINLPFFCSIHPNKVNKETIYLLKDGGCYGVELGVQTYYEQTRKNILNRTTSNKRISNIIHTLSKNKIWVICDNIIGLPGQSIQELVDMALFYSNYCPDIIELFWLSYYPKTEIIKIAKKRGLLADKDIERIEDPIKSKTVILGGSTYNKELSRLQFLLVTLPLFPKFVKQMIVKWRMYHLFPAVPYPILRALVRLFKGHKYDMYRNRNFRKYCYFITKKFYLVFRYSII